MAVIPTEEESIKVQLSVALEVGAIGEEVRCSIHYRAGLDVGIVIGLASIVVYVCAIYFQSVCK